MAYNFLNDPMTPSKDPISLDGPPPDNLVPSGFVESRIRQLNIMSSKDRPKLQNSLHVANVREGEEVCSPACQGTRLEVTASPPVGHSYPGLRINDSHSDDNGVAWEATSISAHMYNNLDLANSGASPLGKAVSKTTVASQCTPLSRENSSPAEHQYESKHEPTKDTEANEQQELLQNTRSSPTRKATDLISKTPGAGEGGGAGETIGFQDSLRKAAVANSTKSPKQNIESSDASTWRQQLRKVGDTLLSRSNSLKKTHSPSTLGSQLHSPQSPAVFLHNERISASSSRRHEVETKERAFGAHKQMGSIDDNMENVVEEIAEIAETEPKITLTAPDEDPEMPISHHICEWRSRYLGLSTAFDKLKSELDIALQHQSNPDNVEQGLGTASRHDQYNDYGIEGLTIIVHRRYKEDLVLNTDLREEELGDIGE
ncbi:hypothetical protein M441DRAFT_444822 [Trichoderma asperellum CBS 433.97]|uniref:Uncharacterized protein n=1 Tax=Trichoderma asperellum (strain ATCC 204424 / CBS 433.97 / NBRC 101777) TaxID=1042311 RepID=A0A2T3ZN80_TRIA4|nr:hypothetical protein M441DRAFT_444822 [Trichoderma asperellum CBS 433.97]PTB46258.1 hypothetical protein M441DRAFT_444822 [Trichoderma asperellum CBS 433.97]